MSAVRVVMEHVGRAAAPLQVQTVFGYVPQIPGEAEWRGQIPPDALTFTLPTAGLSRHRRPWTPTTGSPRQ